MNFVRSANPEVAIAKGAVLFSMNHNIVSPRIAKYTFGIKVCRDWDENKYKNGGIKEYNTFDDLYECINIFYKFITKGDNLRPDDVISKSFNLEGPIGTIILYKTNENDVLFCDEKDENGNLIVSKLGELIIDAKDKYDPLKKKLL